MIAWLVVCAVVAAASVALLLAVARAAREVPPTRDALGMLRHELQPALVRLRNESAATRARLARRTRTD